MGAGDLDALAARAQAGDQDARRELLASLQRYIFKLALRFFGHPADAEDATQDALLLVDRALPRFERRSKTTTWVHTIAMRSFLRRKRSEIEVQALAPEELQAALDATTKASPAEEALVADAAAAEIRLACTHAMLLALSRPVRAAYLLVELTGMTDVEAAEALGVARATVRQRVARARRTVAEVVAARCRLIDPAGTCSCRKQALAAAESAPVYLPYAESVPPTSTLDAAARQLDAADAIAEVYRASPEYVAPAIVWDRLVAVAPDLAG